MLPGNAPSELTLLSRVVQAVEDFLAEIATERLVLLEGRECREGLFNYIELIGWHAVSERPSLCLPNACVRSKRNHDGAKWVQLRGVRFHQRITQGAQNQRCGCSTLAATSNNSPSRMKDGS